MNRETRAVMERLRTKSTQGQVLAELQEGYGLSWVEAQVLARRVCELIDEQSGSVRQPGQIVYQAIAIDEPPGKALAQCRKVPVCLTLSSAEDRAVWTQAGATAQRRVRVRRWVYEALAQEGALSQEDLAYLLGTSTRTVKRIFEWYRKQGDHLPSRGEIQDMGRGVSHKIPVIRSYVQGLSFSQISQALGQHGIGSMARYLRHFALVMVLTDRGIGRPQIAGLIGTSARLIGEYQELYAELNVSAYQQTLARLKASVLLPPGETAPQPETKTSGKGGR